ncbi:MinD/ParA family protein [Candidatus Nitrospira inopinata]|jgi:flagellar biosynthesis protein FlhG|uniref:Site-determining protein n=1 Tax=Candidatus Nitrospira inopinata TaxID=1715989 RepID=A0A0S4KTL7_9BACT|nr:MinD/ParA family protein [Candidatus Nitrospira inopinata]CUQ67119.1 Site-determining protein [Candidatus Nitrospira inopinata]
MRKNMSGVDDLAPAEDLLAVRTRVVAVSSGKGGVGKTNVVANWAVALGRSGKRVLVLDADLGLGNLDVLLGLVPRHTIEHALSGVCTLKEICLEGPAGIQVLPASSGVPHLTSLTESQQLVIQEQLEELAAGMDVLLIDTGAGISPNVTFFASSAHEIVIVVTPEPTSLTDAYALIKVLTRRYRERRFKVLVNQARGPREAAEVFRRLDTAVDRFLQVAVEPIGYVPHDDYVTLAVMRQKAVADLFPDSPAAQAFARLAEQVMQWPLPDLPKSSVQLLWRRMIHLG